MTTAAEVVVVGAGILGCSITVHLVDRGVRPVLIDPERPGQGTSTGSFASISAFGKDPVAWFHLACAGMSGWPRLPGPAGRRGRAGPAAARRPHRPGGGRLLRLNDGQVEPPLVLAACRTELEVAGVARGGGRPDELAPVTGPNPAARRRGSMRAEDERSIGG